MYSPSSVIGLVTTAEAPNFTFGDIFILSIIVEFIPRIHSLLIFTKPAIATLGDKKQHSPISES